MYSQVAKWGKIGFAVYLLVCLQTHAADYVEAKELAENKYQDLIKKYKLEPVSKHLSEENIEALICGNLDLSEFATKHEIGGGFRIGISNLIKHATPPRDPVEKGPDDELQRTFESYLNIRGLKGLSDDLLRKKWYAAEILAWDDATRLQKMSLFRLSDKKLFIFNKVIRMLKEPDVSQANQAEFEQLLKRFDLVGYHEKFIHYGIDTVAELARLQVSPEEFCRQQSLSRFLMSTIQRAVVEAQNMQAPIQLADQDKMRALFRKHQIERIFEPAIVLEVTIAKLQKMTEPEIKFIRQQLSLHEIAGHRIGFDNLLAEIRK